ncbi:hypothetical protein AVEN_184891-1 [Araneus ventricosus]|uniref:Uncharacterized protein n=1 Tax=Araneus ventricosus TaxID=182803 RepID=A0A4Y2GGA4_ARAVE|nr:hypothetical protein AVEN_184891-1 [Araneus ventricosus]
MNIAKFHAKPFLSEGRPPIAKSLKGPMAAPFSLSARSPVSGWDWALGMGEVRSFLLTSDASRLRSGIGVVFTLALRGGQRLCTSIRHSGPSG